MTDPCYLELTGELPDFFAEEMEGLFFLEGVGAVQTITRDFLPPDCADVPPEGVARLVVYLTGAEDPLVPALKEVWTRFLAEKGEAPERWPLRIRPLANQNWATAWQAYFHPMHIGSLWVAPTWEPAEPGAGEPVILLDPGMAFGSGSHETTTLCLLAVEKAVREQGKARMLDVGTGSGILAIAAAKWGATAVGIDNDPEAVRVAGENADLNHVAEAVAVSAAPVGELTERFPFVIANILAGILVELAPSITARVEEAGTLVLSGILTEQQDEVVAAYGALGFSLREQAARGEWVCLTLAR